MTNYIDDAVNNIRKRRKQVNTVPDDPNNIQKPPSNTPPPSDADIKNQMENMYQQQINQKMQQEQDMDDNAKKMFKIYKNKIPVPNPRRRATQ
jgi:small-conductance mechanosensitive channel